MNRVAISALFILIAAMVIASQGNGLLEKIKVFEASCANKISEVRALPIFDPSYPNEDPPRAPVSIAPEAKTLTFNFPDFSNRRHFLDSHARHLQRFVLNLINSDHQGE
jgi:hypothetical protein